MTARLHALLESERPVGLEQIERTLAEQDDRSDQLEAVLSALIWRRRTEGRYGLLGAFLHRDCAERIGVLADHLETVGAVDAAAAVRELNSEIPLDDRRLGGGMIDWIDSRPDIVDLARRLDTQFDDIAPLVWTFLRESTDELPNLEIEQGGNGVAARIARMKSFLAWRRLH